MHQPDNTGFWVETMRWIAEYAPSIYAGLAAIGVSSLMAIKDGKPKKYIVTASCVCGIIALSLSGLLQHFGLPDNSAAALGGAIGFVGADKLRDIVINIVARRTRGDGNDGE
ncbi:phage holin, lambda family [Yersinia pekkanenii]|uniref:Phage holin n=1 Tax=Yersinia pekkanenii TaxID=1288385 RepID=A0A0T9RIJ4_9GAMM|nr:phage holin, lambda family [Yersinia pekkanenii]CNI62821.1 phage holin [Yersinia pekkanenii]CRY67561.1 phage holin [Yersinia pekkanenii]